MSVGLKLRKSIEQVKWQGSVEPKGGAAVNLTPDTEASNQKTATYKQRSNNRHERSSL